jgi:hypothetical protein
LPTKPGDLSGGHTGGRTSGGGRTFNFPEIKEEDIVINNKLIRRACLAAVAGLLPLSAVAQDKGGDNWSISGWINEALIYYDDGNSSDIVQASDNGTTLGSRITLAGSTDLENTGMSAGFEVILEPLSNSTPLIEANQANSFNLQSSARFGTGFSDTTGADIGVLGTSGYVSGPFGKLTAGLQSMPTDNIAVLANPSLTLWSSISPVFRGNGFNIQGIGSTVAVWGDFLNCYTAEALRGIGGIGIDCNGIYRNGVRYDLPTFIEPLSIAVGYANDDVYDIAAKFKTDLGRMQALLYLGYAENHGVNGQFYDSATNFQLQAGLMDPVTGIFGTIAYQNETADFTDAIVADAVPMDAANPTNAESRALATVNNIEDNTNAFWIKVGVKRAFTSIGDTALTFQYGLHNDQFGQNQAIDGVNGSEVQRIGFSIDQYFGSRLIVYAAYENLDLDVDVLTDSPADMNNTYDDADALDLFTLGMTFFF